MYPEKKPGRAWLEISLENIKWNYRQIETMLPEGCRVMAVVKADAYGHGAGQVALALQEIGCELFSVASLEEGIGLRTAGIRGDILILGYTMPRDAFLLKRYGLIQTLVDEAHANALFQNVASIRAHLAVDTGMNRLGISYKDREAIVRVLKEHPKIEGIYSHMSAADGTASQDKIFTKEQIAHFTELCSFLDQSGLTGLQRHMQSSYGILFYPMQGMSYVRPGIALYGCASNHTTESLGLPLKPALCLKSRIGCIRTVEAGEFVSYGRAYEAKEIRRVAVLAVGYADGLPRSLSGRGSALVRGRRAPIIGRICMDQTILDVTDIPDAEAGDIATWIGTDGKEEIKAVEMAECAGTITNELLSRLGGRLTKTYVDFFSEI